MSGEAVWYFVSFFLGISLMGIGLWYLQFRCEDWWGWLLAMASILAGIIFFGIGIDRLNL